MPQIIVRTLINAPRPLVFDLARDVAVHEQTVPWTKEKAVGAVTTGKLNLGDIVTFDAVHFGVRQKLTAEMTEFEYPVLFGDVMLSGAFSALQHIHRFEEPEPRANDHDRRSNVHVPTWPTRKIADALFLKQYMTRFIERRNENLKLIAERTAAENTGDHNDRLPD